MKPEVLGPINHVFADKARAMQQMAARPRVITPESVYQQANEENRSLIHEMLDELLLPGSGILGVEHVQALHERALAGQPCLILMEHYSNFDLPCLYYLLSRSGLQQTADSVVAIAGMKLTEESDFVNAFAEGYTRIIIYPSRSLRRVPDPVRLKQEQVRSLHINMAATRAMIRLKHRGRIVLVFPSGTRYREGRPETKQGVKEVDSYIKSFDTMVFVATAGNVLRIDPAGDMSADIATRDLVLMSVSAPLCCRDFREEARAANPPGKDPKQHVADAVMERLAELHERTAEERQARLQSPA